jgi:hypothetical protein
MKNHGRIYAITSGAIIILALVLLVVIFVLWYMFGYDYVIAPNSITLFEKAGSVV